MRQFHNVKILEQYANAKVAGDKPWEIRINDRNYQKGDIVVYNAVKVGSAGFVTNINDHVINERVYIIDYVYSGEGVAPGYVVFSDRDITDDYSKNKDKYLNS